MPKTRDKDLELGRYCMAIQKSRLQLRWSRQKRLDMVREYLGAHWSEDAAEKSTPINLVSLFINVISRKLVPKNPRVMISAMERGDKPAASILQQYGNEQIERMKLANPLRRVVIDGLFSYGIGMVALAGPADSAIYNWRIKAGQPFYSYVDPDDFAYDIHARDFDQAGWMARRMRVPLEVVRESKIYGTKRKEVQATPDPMFNMEGDERISMIGRGYYSNDEEYEDFTDLWEIYIPRHKVIVTVAAEDVPSAGQISISAGKSDIRAKALRIQKWIGPENGPFYVLGYGVAPGNAMYKGPVHDIYDLHLSVNNMARKLINQAHRQKSVLPVSSAEEYDRLQQTSDGEGFRCDRPDVMKEIRYGGPDQANYQLMEAYINQANRLSGNLDLIGGLGPQARTATQDKMNETSSSANINSLADDTINYASDILKGLCWYWHNHPRDVIRVNHSLPGLPNISIMKESYPNNPQIHGGAPGKIVRNTPFEEMNIRVDPYSMQHQTPQQRAALIMQAIQFYAPLAQQAQQQGVVLDINEVFKKLGEYWDMPDLADIFTMQEPPAGADAQGAGLPGAGQAPPPGGPPQETIHTRRSMGDQSQQAKEAVISNFMKRGGMNGSRVNGQQVNGAMGAGR